MHWYLNSPMQLPLPLLTPLWTTMQPFQSPYISPYNGPIENYLSNRQHHVHLDDEFVNFQLDQPQEGQKVEKAEQVEEVEEAEFIEPESEEQQIVAKEEPVVETPELPQRKQSRYSREKANPQNDSDEQSFGVSQENCEITLQIKRIVNFLIKYVDKSQENIQYERQKYFQNDKQMGEVFDVLVKKFKKLKKTKEEMTKYCMRKAFKFLAEKYKKELDGSRDSTDFLKDYFERVEGEAFSVPFKKNSQEKTMNTVFLKKVFSSLTFVSDYKHFLKSFNKAVDDDNNKKIRYLASTIKTFLQGGSIKKLEALKRLPWTETILDKTIDLAHKLLNHAESFHHYSQFEIQDKGKKILKAKNLVHGSPSTRRKSTTASITDVFATNFELEERSPKRQH